MSVNSLFNNFFTHRLKMWFGLASILLAIFLIASSFTKHPDRDLRSKQTNLIIRQIGHRLLLQSGDATSRVLPVTEIKEGTFLLTFEKEFIFSHDSLIALATELLPQTQFPSGYTVTVHECEGESIVNEPYKPLQFSKPTFSLRPKPKSITYGFQINKNSPDNLACKGRSQPNGCYTIEIAFTDLYETPSNFPLINLAYSSMLLALGVTLLIGRFGKIAPAPVQNQERSIIKDSVSELTSLGKFLFDVKGQRLLLGTEVINLTSKECRILELLYKNFNELISRETLMEKIWISEGVITGRSLDMFVSKLRKKLSSDPDLRITNVHGKGYKLEIQCIRLS